MSVEAREITATVRRMDAANGRSALETQQSDAAHALDAELRAAIAFLLVEGVGSGRLRRLREAFGSASAALWGACEDCTASRVAESASRVAESASRGDSRASLEAHGALLAEALRCDAAVATRMLAEARAVDPARELAAIEAHGARIVLARDSRYPALLASGVDAPELLFVRGELDAPPELAVAIVGSRRATSYGRLQAGRLALELAERGVTIVSGGARGIDAEAHRGALRAGGRTIAVLATGVARPYPPEHASLFDEIVVAGGATIGEQPSFIAARPELFPRRNRIIAALSLVTVVVEAANRSGALLTARLAVDDYGRDAACLPGPVDSVSSEGCHRAIREGWAQLVTNADDVCQMLAETRSLVDGAIERQRSLQRAMEAQGARGLRESTRAEAVRGAGATRSSVGRRPSKLASPSEPRIEAPPLPPGSDAELVLHAIRDLRSAGLDELERTLGWDVPRLAAATLVLELRGIVRRATDGGFEAVAGGRAREAAPGRGGDGAAS